MTDRDALIKELDLLYEASQLLGEDQDYDEHTQPNLSAIGKAWPRIREALSVPGDAERERLLEYFNWLAENCSYILNGDKVEKIRALLRRPVEPVVTGQQFYEALYGHKGGGWCGVDDEARYVWNDAAKRLNAALNVSQPGVK